MSNGAVTAAVPSADASRESGNGRTCNHPARNETHLALQCSALEILVNRLSSPEARLFVPSTFSTELRATGMKSSRMFCSRLTVKPLTHEGKNQVNFADGRFTIIGAR